MKGLFGRIAAYVRLNGGTYTAKRAWEKFRDRTLREYDKVYRTERADESELKRQRAVTFDGGDLVSVLVPVYNTDPRMLTEMAQSLLAQTCGAWEAVLYDGRSTKQATRDTLKGLEALDPRLRIIYGTENLNISGNSNRALTYAKGNYVALLDHDDLLSPDAVFRLMEVISASHPDMMYSDEDKISEDSGVYFEPHFKPDFCLDNLRAGNYICHLMSVKKTLLEAAGGFRSAFDGSQDHDLAMRCAEKAESIVHIPRVLYHWRHVGASMSHQNLEKCMEAARGAVEESIGRSGQSGRVSIEGGVLRVRYDLRGEPPVSVVIAASDRAKLALCLAGVEKLKWTNMEILVVTDAENLPAKVRRVARGGRNLYAALNAGVAEAKGAYVLTLAEDVVIEHADFIQELLMYAQRADVAVVTPILFDGRGRILHAGYAVGETRIAACRQKGLPRTAGGWHGMEHTSHDVAACSAACCMFRRECFLPMGEDWQGDAAGADWSLRMRAQGGYIVFTPHAKAVARQGAPVCAGTVSPEDAARFRKAWPALHDPCYNEHFDPRDGQFRLDHHPKQNAY